MTDSTLVLVRDSDEIALALKDVFRLEQSQGDRLSVIGGFAGLLLGVAAGGAAGCAANRDSYGVFCGGQDDTKVVVGAALGGLAGAALGAWLLRRERWEELPIALFTRE